MSEPSPTRASAIPTLSTLAAGVVLLGAAFAWGRVTAPAGEGPVLEAQGRGPVGVPDPPVEPPVAVDPAETAVFPVDGGGAASASANGFLAVTGSYGIGTSVLYLVDTESRQLAVYEARGGAAGMRRVVLVGARRIDLDLQLEGYNDKSEYSHGDLETLFERRNRRATEREADGGR